ncbi:MAG: nuclear transport factor 2 family protein [Lautropia sp.]
MAEPATERDAEPGSPGLEAIRAWKAAASKQYTCTGRPFPAERIAPDRYVVQSHISGDFPGCLVDLRYAFRLARGLIDSLKIAV